MISGAVVSATHVRTGIPRQMISDSRGSIVFNGLPAGEYTLDLSKDSFKPAERRGLVLATGEWLALNAIVLEAGSMTERVSVTAEGTMVQTASSERSGVITSNQVDNLLIKGRNVMSLLQLLPGRCRSRAQRLDYAEPVLHVNGIHGNMNNVTLDGLLLINVGGGQGHVVQVGLDMVAEVKVLLSNYQAEYGVMGGTIVTVVAKSGTRDYHGLGSYFKRHEQSTASTLPETR